MAYDVKKVLEVQRILYETDVVSLNTVIRDTTDDGNGGTELGDFVPSEQNMEDEICERDRLRYLLTFINKLSPREQLVIRMRFGLDDNNPKTLEEVGAHFGVTRERARQVEAKALRKLKRFMSAAGVNYNSF